MAYAPIQLFSTPQEDYAGYWVKFYEQGTVTPLSMATDATGGTLIVKAEISSGGTVPIGFIKTAGDALLNPFINASYDCWLFPTSAEADANDTTNAIQVADNLNTFQSSVTSLSSSSFAIAAGTVDVITAAMSPAVTAYTDGLQVNVRASGANTSTTPTLNIDSVGAKTITKMGNTALRYGDIPGGSYEMTLRYNSANDVFELLNPAVYPALSGETGVTRSDFPVGDSRRYGTIGDGTTDDTAALQAAIDSCIITQIKLRIPIGEYLTSSTLFMMRWSGTAFSFFSLDVEGEKSSFAGLGGAPQLKGVHINPNFSTTPGIIIQGARAVHMSDVSITGLNLVDDQITSGAGWSEMLNNATFTTTGRDSQYSPYAGICIDPFGTSTPSDGGYPGMTSYYSAGAAGSSDISFDRVIAEKFIVGFMITPNQTTTNAENILFNDCKAQYCKVGLAIGQSQSRAVDWFGGNIAWNLFGVDCVNYGQGTGSSPNIFGCNMSGKYLFNVHGRYGNPFNVYGIHAESFGSIGFLGANTSSAEPANFHGCAFHFALAQDIPMVDFHLYSENNVNFFGCEISYGSANLITYPLRFHVGVGCAFIGGSIDDLESEFYIAPTDGSAPAGEGVQFQNFAFNDNSGRGVDYTLLDSNKVISNWAALDNQVIPVGASLNFNDSTEVGNQYFNGDYMPLTTISAAIAVTNAADGTATFTPPDDTIIRVGDLVYTLTAKSYEGPDLTASISSNFQCLGIVSDITAGVVTISGWPQTMITGTYHLRHSWWRRAHQATTGDTNTSTSITNVDQPGSWEIGQKIRGAGITEGTYITNISGSTFTISKAASATAAGVRLYDADLYSIAGTAV